MTLGRLKWLTVLVPLAFIVLLEVASVTVGARFFGSWPGVVLVLGVALIGILFFAEAIFTILDRMQQRQLRQTRELLATHEAGLDIAEELELEIVLQRVVDRAATLVGARYGALSLPATGGGIAAFITTGITAAERAEIGPPPVGHGLLAVVLKEGQRLRLADLTKDPRSQGFPPRHPPMRSLLAVPIASRGQLLGNLYLTEKIGETSFTADDEAILARFATQAAVAIQNAHLLTLAREAAVGEERARIAREMHDSVAQVLGYVNTKAQAAQEFLRAGQRDRGLEQLEQLGEAARQAYADVREDILNLRANVAPRAGFSASLERYLEHWQEQSGIAVRSQLEGADELLGQLPPSAELQLLRIIQEALSNVRKHARATEATVRLYRDDRGVIVSVEDNGVGFNPETRGQATSPRFGLLGMRERSDAIGARIAVDSAPGSGTRVTVTVPPRAQRPAA